MKPHWLSVCIVAAIALLGTTEPKSDEPGNAPASAADPMSGKKPGDVRDDNGLKMKLVWCPPGIFTMENYEVITEPAVEKENQPNDDEVVDPKDDPAPKPKETIKTTPVKVFLTKGYWLGKYEVTQSEWKQVMQSEPWKDQKQTKEGDGYPATFVSWNDAVEFCRKLTEQERQAGRLPTGNKVTLPTEAQWERACRARTETKFGFGDDESKLGDYAWFYFNSWHVGEQYAHEVGQKKANPWDFFDMHGNVWEWCRDIYTEKLPGGRDPEVKADEKTKGSFRVDRGGSWFNDAAYCRSGSRHWIRPDYRYGHSAPRLSSCPQSRPASQVSGAGSGGPQGRGGSPPRRCRSDWRSAPGVAR